MFVVNDDLSIYANRGDIVFFSVSADDSGNLYKFQPGDIVRMSIYGKKEAETVVLQKDFPVTEVCESVFIYLEEADTKIGESISKHKDYWYEVVLNPDTMPQTIIGYDEDGAKIFRLFPEAEEIEDGYDPQPEDFPVVDTELDMLSLRPVSNSAIARAVATILDTCEKTNAAVAALHVTPEMCGAIGDGVADDTQAFADAVASLTDNGTLLLRGKYVVAKLLVENIQNLTVTGGGTVYAKDGCDLRWIEFKSCNNLTVENITLDGRNQMCRALNLRNLDGFKVSGVCVENVGNDAADNSMYGISCVNAHNGCIDNTRIKYVHAASVATGIILEGDTDDEVPKNILVDHVHIEDIAPIADADGVKILSAGVDANLTVSNSVFIDCAKRALKFQAKNCYSHNNVIYVNAGNYASIDFQCGHGKSIDDTIHYNVSEIGISGYGYAGVAVSSQTEVRGLRVTVANNLASLYAEASSSGMFLVQNLMDEERLQEIVIKDCRIDGCTTLVRNLLSVPVKRIVIENVTLEKLYRHSIFEKGHYWHVVFQNNILANRPLDWHSFFNGATYDTCDMDITNVVAADTNVVGRPSNINSRLTLRCATDTFVSGSFVYENGKMVFYAPTDVNPQGSIYSSGKNFAMAKKGDICYLATPVSKTDGFCVGYVCTADPDATYTRGQWKEIYM